MIEYLDLYYGDDELSEKWCSEGNPLLEIGILFDKKECKQLIMSPREKNHNINIPLTDIESAELCLFYRDTDLIFNKIAKVLNIKETLLQIGYGKSFVNQDNSINEELINHSNDYSLYNTVFKLLGLDDAVYGNAPELDNYPTVSVIIPGYKVEDTIEDVIESFYIGFKNCNVANWEIVIIDDANEKKIELNKENVKVIRSDEKVYCGGARNIGINNSQGEIVIFCDGDTFIAHNYIKESLFRQMIAPNIITVCMRENIDKGANIPERLPSIMEDTRYYAVYHPDRIGSTAVNKTIEVRALNETDNFMNFGYGKKLGPADLPFMVKGNNICVSRTMAKVLFPPNFIGYGPEDVTFSAKLIARGCKVIPILSSGVYHRKHVVRSESIKRREDELKNNIAKQMKCLQEKTWEKWEL